MLAASFRFSLMQLLLLTALCGLLVGLLVTSDQAQREARPTAVAFSPDGRWLLAKIDGNSGLNAVLKLWEVHGNQARPRRCSFRPVAYSGKVLFCGPNLITGVADRRLNALGFWDLPEDRPVVPPRPLAYTYGLEILTASEAGTLVLSAPNGTSVAIDVHDWSETPLAMKNLLFNSFSADGRFLIGPNPRPGKMSFARYDLKTDTQLELCEGYLGHPFISRDGKVIVNSAGINSELPLQLTIAGNRVTQRRLNIPSDENVLALSPDGRLIATRVDDEILVRNLETFAIEQRLPRLVRTGFDLSRLYPFLDFYDRFQEPSVSFSPDGQRLAIADARGLAWYDLNTGQSLGVLWRPRRFEPSLIYILGFIIWPFFWARALSREDSGAGEPALDGFTRLAHLGMQRGGPWIVALTTMFLWNVGWYGAAAALGSLTTFVIFIGLVFGLTIGVVGILEWIVPGRSRFLRTQQITGRNVKLRKYWHGRIWNEGREPTVEELNAACREVEERFAQVTGVPAKLGRGVSVVVAETDEEFTPHSPTQPPQHYLIFRNLFENTVLLDRQSLRETLFLMSRALRSAFGHLLLLKTFGRSRLTTWQTVVCLSALAVPAARRRAILSSCARSLRLVSLDMRPYFLAYLRGDNEQFAELVDKAAATDPGIAHIDLFSLVNLFCMDYFCGPETPAERRQKFQRLLAESRGPQNAEVNFRNVFGFDFEQLADALNTFYLSIDATWFGASTAEGQRLVTESALPILADPQATAAQKERVVRGLGYCGVLRGLEVLIPLLDRPDVVPQDCVLAALQQMTGQPLPADANVWQAWSDALPSEVRLGLASAWYDERGWRLDPEGAETTTLTARNFVAADSRPEPASACAPVAPPALQVQIAAPEPAPPAPVSPWLWYLLGFAGLWGIGHGVLALFLMGPMWALPLAGICSGVYALFIVATRDAGRSRLATQWLISNLLFCDIVTFLIAGLTYHFTPRPRPA